MSCFRPLEMSRWITLLAAGLMSTSVFAQDEEEVPRPRRSARPAGGQRLPISLDGGASINPEILKKVKDDTLGLTVDDREAYFRILKLTEKLDPAEQRDLAAEFRQDRYEAHPKNRRRPVEQFPTFVDLFRHPAEYRGRPVTLHGYFRRLVTYDPGKNDQGYEQLYEGWLYADDAQGNPAVVIFTEKPEGLPISGDLSEEVTVTGYFFKMYGYQAHDTTRRAPLLLAQTVRWRPQPPASRWTPSPQAYFFVSAAILVIAVMIALAVRESHAQRQLASHLRSSKYEQYIPFDEAESPKPSSHWNGSSAEPHH